MDAPTITAAALDVLDDVGLDALSMRLVAARLDVRVGGLYYHLPDKSALLRAMANEVCAQALDDFDSVPAGGESPAAGAARLCATIRAALLGRRDAARVLCSGPLNGSALALALMDRLIGLLEPALGAAHAGAAADALMSYLTGFVLQEQAAPPADYPFDEPLDVLRARYPRVFRAARRPEDEMFGTAVDAIVAGFAR